MTTAQSAAHAVAAWERSQSPRMTLGASATTMTSELVRNATAAGKPNGPLRLHGSPLGRRAGDDRIRRAGGRPHPRSVPTHRRAAASQARHRQYERNETMTPWDLLAACALICFGVTLLK